ncbi:MAG: double-strand break repair helicase AddA [Rhodobacteraceae bacterium]|nr:double-strand break repair helicase AddA [Paracoccaceae bacterium]MYF45054.1 double-strand break repair helicase AddA [Paracoccaceae bacterium]MYI91432.1 double-strand break repair helicase AddA [Paracoccaceae bacterium]
MVSNRFDEATLPQVKAANPFESSWVLANAGSGKTRVLTNRVVRLLLAGTSPQKILCITFTNAAATNMLNRLVETLGGWAMLPNDDLRDKLLELGEDENSLTPEKLDSARTLFARALETPGGMKIQTFHSFATALLRQFPREAGVSPQFKLIDDRKARNIQIDLLNELVATDRNIVEQLSKYLDYESLKQFTKDIFDKRDDFNKEATKEFIWKKFDVREDWDGTSLVNSVTPDDIRMIESLLPILQKGSITDRKKGALIGETLATGKPDLIVSQLIECLISKPNSKNPYSVAKFPTNPTKQMMGSGLVAEFESFAEHLSQAKINEENFQGAQRTLLLHQFAGKILDAYREKKRKNAWLDFDDLLTSVLEILRDPDISQWILYRLDEDIDHILVDEAQDVNTKQWKIVSILAEEFTSGVGQRGDLVRTVFAVGDEKQSIFGFQGAAPERFRERRDYFKEKFEKSGRKFIEEDLEFSFRSSNEILRLVDGYLNLYHEKFYTRFIPHKAYKDKLPGWVELWPLAPKRDTSDEEEWYIPGFVKQEKKPAEILAQNLVAKIKKMIDNEFIPTDKNGKTRRVRPGDILILVQSRGSIYRSMIKELKKAGLPLAGTDRITLSDDLAVKDLLALLLFLSVPKDDLSLAVVLKSPLFGFDEDDIFRLAHGRTGSLWDVLETRKDSSGRFSNAHRILSELRSLAGEETPYDLLEKILTVYEGRKLLVARLGISCIEALDLLLVQALEYEIDETPSLTGFLEWLEPGAVNIKRQFEQQQDEIRVMSVHGAKGLESPIVILPDTRSLYNHGNVIVPCAEDNFPLWSTKPEITEPVANGLKKIESEDWKEYLRLLYVAMTRAESRLIICGAQTRKDLPKSEEQIKDWYEMIYWVMSRNMNEAFHDFSADLNEDMTNKYGYMLRSENWPMETDQEPDVQKIEDITLPHWVEKIPVWETPGKLSESPSNLGGDKVVSGEIDTEATSDSALLKGNVIHLLLEHLPNIPRTEWEIRGKQLIDLKYPDIVTRDRSEWIANSIAILENPDLKFLFDTSETNLEEVAITAEIPELDNKPIFGYIDRLVIADDHVLAVDFKTNRLVPANVDETPEGLLRQMGAYHRALEKIYPDKKIKTAILWTQTGELSKLPEELTLNALKRAFTMADTQSKI